MSKKVETGFGGVFRFGFFWLVGCFLSFIIWYFSVSQKAKNMRQQMKLSDVNLKNTLPYKTH